MPAKMVILKLCDNCHRDNSNFSLLQHLDIEKLPETFQETEIAVDLTQEELYYVAISLVDQFEADFSSIAFYHLSFYWRVRGQLRKALSCLYTFLNLEGLESGSLYVVFCSL